MRRPNHASRFEGIAKTNLQASRASDTETLQSQIHKAAKKRLSLSELEILHGRLFYFAPTHCSNERRYLLHCMSQLVALGGGSDVSAFAPLSGANRKTY